MVEELLFAELFEKGDCISEFVNEGLRSPLSLTKHLQFTLFRTTLVLVDAGSAHNVETVGAGRSLFDDAAEEFEELGQVTAHVVVVVRFVDHRLLTQVKEQAEVTFGAQVVECDARVRKQCACVSQS